MRADGCDVLVNIHTHFVPLVLSLLSCTVLGPSADYVSWPDMVYTYFARVCLLTSAIWHCFAGCSHPGAMEFFARLDYVGIGWYEVSDRTVSPHR